MCLHTTGFLKCRTIISSRLSSGVLRFDPLVSESITPSSLMKGIGSACVSICDPVYLYVLILWSWITLWKWLRQCHVGGKIDVYSTLQCLQKVNVKGIVERRRSVRWEVSLRVCVCIWTVLYFDEVKGNFSCKRQISILTSWEIYLFSFSQRLGW